MAIDVVQVATIAGAIITIVSLAKLVVEPFRVAMKRNDTTMKHLETTLNNLARDLKDSQRDRENIHKILDSHEMRIGKNEDDIIRHTERINRLN